MSRHRSDDEDETWDIGSLLFLLLLLAAVLAWGLGTHQGNHEMCKDGIAPTFIDCAKAS